MYIRIYIYICYSMAGKTDQQKWAINMWCSCMYSYSSTMVRIWVIIFLFETQQLRPSGNLTGCHQTRTVYRSRLIFFETLIILLGIIYPIFWGLYYLLICFVLLGMSIILGCFPFHQPVKRKNLSALTSNGHPSTTG